VRTVSNELDYVFDGPGTAHVEVNPAPFLKNFFHIRAIRAETSVFFDCKYLASQLRQSIQLLFGSLVEPVVLIAET
jgi:hypothetical protein